MHLLNTNRVSLFTEETVEGPESSAVSDGGSGNKTNKSFGVLLYDNKDCMKHSDHIQGSFFFQATVLPLSKNLNE